MTDSCRYPERSLHATAQNIYKEPAQLQDSEGISAVFLATAFPVEPPPSARFPHFHPVRLPRALPNKLPPPEGLVPRDHDLKQSDSEVVQGSRLKNRILGQ